MQIYEKMNINNTALVVIDIVNGCCVGEEFKRIRDMVPKLKEFVKDYREIAKTPIIFINITPWTKKHLTDNINELYTDPQACYYSEDKSGFEEEFYSVVPEKGDLVFTKNHYDAFVNPDFKKYLKENQIHYLIIAGIFGDGCVLATICGGFSRGYNFVILKDLIETTDASNRQALQKILKKYTWPIMYGKTITSKEFLKFWKELLKK